MATEPLDEGQGQSALQAPPDGSTGAVVEAADEPEVHSSIALKAPPGSPGAEEPHVSVERSLTSLVEAPRGHGPGGKAVVTAAGGGGRELAETLNEDGRLLRMFVARNCHLKPDARDHAVRDWLIRETFYDEWCEQFVERYSPASALVLSDEDRQKREQELARLWKGKPEVDRLETSVQTAKGDVHVLRDTLLAAIDDLITPRRRATKGEDGRQMTPEAIELMKQKRQHRLRVVILDCLSGIWSSGNGGEVLKAVMDRVRTFIDKFEAREDDIRMATSGDSWHRLKQLVTKIEGVIPETAERRKHLEVEGRGTKILIQKAIEDLGGKACTADVLRWVEDHPEALEEHIKLNRNVREKSTGVKEGGGEKKHKYLVWHNTVRSVLSANFSKSSEKNPGGVYEWLAKGSEEVAEAAELVAKRRRRKAAAIEGPAQGEAAAIEGPAEGNAAPIQDAAPQKRLREASAEVEGQT